MSRALCNRESLELYIFSDVDCLNPVYSDHLFSFCLLFVVVHLNVNFCYGVVFGVLNGLCGCFSLDLEVVFCTPITVLNAKKVLRNIAGILYTN